MIVLVNPKQFEEKVFYINLGLATIAAIIRDAGYETHVIDFDSYKVRGNDLGGIDIPCASVVLVSGMITNLQNICSAAAAVRARCPDATYVLGGGAASVSMEEIYGYLGKWFDYFVLGEGDELVIPLLRYLGGELGQLPPNVLSWNHGKRMTDGIRQYGRYPDIARVPMPAYDLFDVESYVAFLRRTGRSFEMYASKGCACECSFCYRISGSRVRYRNVSNVIAEMDCAASRYGITSFSFEDDNFGTNDEWLRAFCSSVGRRGYRFRFQAQINSLRKREKLKRLTDAGLSGLSMGIESGSTRILKELNKRNDLKVASEIIRYCNANGVQTSGTFILGSPAETWESVEDTRRFLIENRLDSFQVFFLTPYPGTALFDEAVKRGRISSVLEYVMQCGCLDELNVNLTSLSDETLYEMRGYLLRSVEELRGVKIASPVTWRRDAP